VTVLPIDPSVALGGEWRIPGLSGPDAAGGAAGVGGEGGFGAMLGQEVGKLAQLQTDASSAAQSLANGTATDPSTVVVAVEKAQLAMQLAGQIRTKGSEAINDIFHTQI
jgi:flagellar hook-basal body complex protein FliE